MLIRYRIGMFTTPKSLPSDPVELRIAAEGLVELAKTQALQIEKLKHQLAGHQRYRFGSKADSADQLNLQLRLEVETAAVRTAPPRKKPLPQSRSRNQSASHCPQLRHAVKRFSAPVRRANAAAICAASARM